MCFKIKIKSALFLMFWKRNIFLERMNNKKCGGTMFVRMMLNKPINVNFERIMHIWFAEILKEMKAAVNQLENSMWRKQKVKTYLGSDL